MVQCGIAIMRGAMLSISREFSVSQTPQSPTKCFSKKQISMPNIWFFLQQIFIPWLHLCLHVKRVVRFPNSVKYMGMNLRDYLYFNNFIGSINTVWLQIQEAIVGSV